jgi:hypothetical protein
MREKVLKLDHEYSGNQGQVFWALIIGIVVLMGFYIFLINKTVMNVAARGALEKNISAMNSKIGELEFKYISLKNKVNIELAYSMGFKDVLNPQYISLRTLGRVSTSDTIQ